MTKTKPTKDPRGGNHGGGRPRGERTVPLSIRITPEASSKLQAVKNKSEYIDKLILSQ